MTEACLEKTVVTDSEANPEEIDSESEYQEVSKEESLVETIRALKDRRAPPAAEEMEPGRSWIPEEADFIRAVVNCRLCDWR
jgi:hypothetical protein